jgi:hypothetical protein
MLRHALPSVERAKAGTSHPAGFFLRRKRLFQGEFCQSLENAPRAKGLFLA